MYSVPIAQNVHFEWNFAQMPKLVAFKAGFLS